ncbi:hypothetical protein CBM2586_A11515 [Cupriavidus phytorum]|uniref:Uncharacterized protein n=1 Tax=Cupriavidus taiwanensis TaxID=164546 RepID=A0A375BE95_9BURK|nr:hypothetical protein CBM2586_A11515 [Cupriavidus taiwanensis]
MTASIRARTTGSLGSRGLGCMNGVSCCVLPPPQCTGTRRGCQGPEHGRPGRHGRRSLWGGLGRPNGETNRNFCRICDHCGYVLSRYRARVAAAARTLRQIMKKATWMDNFKSSLE